MDVQDYIDLKLVHEIHTSERRSFRACRRRWDWLFRQSLYPKTTAKPLEFGVAYHNAMEVYYNPDTWGQDREVIAALAILKFVETCNTQKKNALEQTGQVQLESDVETDYAERVLLGQGMLNYYFRHVAPYEDVNWTPVKVEISFMVPIPNPETGEPYIWCKCDNCWEKQCKHVDTVIEKDTPNWIPLAQQEGERENHWQGLPVVYAGRLDMLARDEYGGYWIFDWKTAARISSDDEFLYLDDQVGSYPWALRFVGLDIRGFVYHEQLKGYPEPPPQNKTTRLGRKFSVSKSINTSYAMYKRTVEVEDTKAYEDGLYDDYLNYLQIDGTHYFKRHQIIKSYEELESIEENIGFEALDMIDPNLRIYPSAGRFGCNYCAFRQPCMEKNSKGDYQYALDTMYEKMEHYYVRAEASTESKGGE